MDRAVKAAILAVIGIFLFLVALVALPRTVASLIMDMDVPGEGVFAAVAFGAVTIGIGALAWIWGAMVLRMLRTSGDAGQAAQLIEGEKDDDLRKRGSHRER